MNELPHPCPVFPLQPFKDNINARMHIAVIGHRCPREGEPDKQIAGQFLRPEQRVVESIAAEDLEDDGCRHRHAKQKQKVLGIAVAGTAELFDGARCFRPHCTTWFVLSLGAAGLAPLEQKTGRCP